MLEDDLAVFGLSMPEVPDEPEDVYELWWDAQDAWAVFMDLSCPWKLGMDGVVGIDDVAVIAVIRLRPVSKRRRLELFRDVQALLQGGLKYFGDERERRRGK